MATCDQRDVTDTWMWHHFCHILAPVTPLWSQVATCDTGHYTCDNFILWNNEGVFLPYMTIWPYSGIFPGWIFFPSRCHFFLLWWLIMTNFGMSALLSIGCTGQSCLLDREKVSFGPVTSGFLPENHLWIGVMNFEVFTPFLPFCFFFSMLQILSKLSWSFIWHLIIHRKTLFPFIYSSINW